MYLLVESAFFIQPSEDQLSLPDQPDTIHSLDIYTRLRAGHEGRISNKWTVRRCSQYNYESMELRSV